MKHVEDEWGLRLDVGDRDDVGASKIGGFDNGDNVVVCLMRQFIDDSELMTTALGSIKPLPKYIFVLLDVTQSSSIRPRLQQLLLQESASIQVKWSTDARLRRLFDAIPNASFVPGHTLDDVNIIANDQSSLI